MCGAVRFEAAAPALKRDRLPDDCTKPPYHAHCALAVADRPDLPRKSARLRRLLLPGSGGGERVSNAVQPGRPKLDSGRLRDLRLRHGQGDLDATIAWLARELLARRACYGTVGIYPREHFLATVGRFRLTLNSDHGPPTAWRGITASLLAAGVLIPVARHCSREVFYPSYSWAL